MPRGVADRSLAAVAQRWLLGLLWSLKPPRLYGVPGMLAMLARHYAGMGPPPGILPDPENALRHPDGLAGICTDMNVATLEAAYAKGLYPLAHIGPQKWWAPEERMVCLLEDVHIPKNVRRRLRMKQFEVTFDTAFAAIMTACAEPRPGRPHLTWIGPATVESFMALHEAGYAHSVEVWDRAGKLAGGLYGLAIGKVFFIESMFARSRDASKIGFITLSCHLQRWGFVLNDGKRMSSHLSELGFTLMPRASFNALLARACSEPGKDGSWSIDPSLEIARWDPKLGIAQAPSRPL